MIELSEAEMAQRGEGIGGCLPAGPVRLRFDGIRPGDPVKGLAPLEGMSAGHRTPAPENLERLADALERRGGELTKLEQLRKEAGD